MPNNAFRAQLDRYHQRQALEAERRRVEQDAARMRGERADAAALMIKSDPKLSAMAATDTQGRYAREYYGEGSPYAGTYTSRMRNALASDDPIARQYGANAAGIIAARGEAINTANAMALTGGFTLAEFEEQQLKQAGLQRAVDISEQLMTLNNEFGKEVLPGSVRGAYDSLRALAIRNIAEVFEAGALQDAEIKFFNSIIPDFGAFASMSSSERNQKLRQLQEHYLYHAGVHERINPALLRTQVKVNPYTVEEVLGVPAAPPNTDLVEQRPNSPITNPQLPGFAPFPGF